MLISEKQLLEGFISSPDLELSLLWGLQVQIHWAAMFISALL